MSGSETVDDALTLPPSDAPPLPGLVAIFAGQRPMLHAIAVPRGGIVIGRDAAADLAVPDEKASRRHARVRLAGGRFVVEDLGSRNGTRVDGMRIEGAHPADAGSVLRVGHSLVLLVADVRPFAPRPEPGNTSADDPRMLHEGMVVGPRLRPVLHELAALARAGSPAVVTGESGSGKELAARTYHAATSRRGPFVPVNCAAIPLGVAERVLFGARKGAFSGATDAEGVIEAADGGTLFLDELGELELAVQAKLLRVLETREVVPLGAAKGRVVDVSIIAATNRDLRADVAAKRFREDLFFRIGQPEVRLPPLRERKEEIVWLVAQALAALPGAPVPSVDLVEACVTRRWPGNVRELLAEIRHAAVTAGDETGRVVRAEHLDPRAGRAFDSASDAGPVAARDPTQVSREEIESALHAAQGNVSAAARALGLHRTQLYRRMQRLGLRSDAEPDSEGH